MLKPISPLRYLIDNLANLANKANLIPNVPTLYTNLHTAFTCPTYYPLSTPPIYLPTSYIILLSSPSHFYFNSSNPLLLFIPSTLSFISSTPTLPCFIPPFQPFPSVFLPLFRTFSTCSLNSCLAKVSFIYKYSADLSKPKSLNNCYLYYSFCLIWASSNYLFCHALSIFSFHFF